LLTISRRAVESLIISGSTAVVVRRLMSLIPVYTCHVLFLLSSFTSADNISSVASMMKATLIMARRSQ